MILEYNNIFSDFQSRDLGKLMQDDSINIGFFLRRCNLSYFDISVYTI